MLVVDDDDALRTLVVTWLTKAGLACVEARSGEEALESARAMAEGLDAIVCDVMMPGIDGFAVLERLKADTTTAAIPVVLLTAHANAETDIVRGVEAGAVEHLAKPFSGRVLAAKVRAMVTRGRAARALEKKLHFAEKHATIDALTGLFNRRHFEARVPRRERARSAPLAPPRAPPDRPRPLQVDQRHVRSRRGRSRSQARRGAIPTVSVRRTPPSATGVRSSSSCSVTASRESAKTSALGCARA